MSQNISVELSIHWQIGKCIFNEDSMMNTPMLNIVYRNNSNENIYFKKISLPDRVSLPRTGYSMLLQYPYEEWLNPNWRKRAESSLEMSPFFINKSYRVVIDNYQAYSESWYIVNEADTCAEECVDDIINDCISNIHEFIYHKKYPGRFRLSEKHQFTKDNLSEDSILIANRNYFVFLRPDETYTDTFNIVAFQLLKGSYTFEVGNNSIPDFVWDEFIWDDIQQKYIEQKVKLPNKVGEYHLYSGSFFSNSVTVDFSKYE